MQWWHFSFIGYQLGWGTSSDLVPLSAALLERSKRHASRLGVRINAGSLGWPPVITTEVNLTTGNKKVLKITQAGEKVRWVRVSTTKPDDLS